MEENKQKKYLKKSLKKQTDTNKGQICIETDKKLPNKKRQKQTEIYQKQWGHIKFSN